MWFQVTKEINFGVVSNYRVNSYFYCFFFILTVVGVICRVAERFIIK